ncbi:MAG: tetratricopeptide repeat protein, partial [Kangiellaceae bacterium]|nr:tetratricopeptide repeat protein [Kangiellaceae bacterium]
MTIAQNAASEKLPQLIETAETLVTEQAYAEAEAVLQHALQVAQQHQALDWQAKTHNALGMVRARQGAYVQSINAFEASRDAYLKLDRIRAAAMVQRNIGLQYRRLGLFEMSDLHLQQSADAFQQLQQACGMAFSQMERGTTQMWLGHYYESERLLNEAKKRFADCEHESHGLYYASTYDRLATLFRNQGRWQEAADQYDRAFLKTPAGASLSRGHILTNMAELAYQRGDFQASLAKSEEALATFSATASRDDLLHCTTLKAKALFQLGRLNAALELLDPALTLL